MCEELTAILGFIDQGIAKEDISPVIWLKSGTISFSYQIFLSHPLMYLFINFKTLHELPRSNMFEIFFRHWLLLVHLIYKCLYFPAYPNNALLTCVATNLLGSMATPVHLSWVSFLTLRVSACHSNNARLLQDNSVLSMISTQASFVLHKWHGNDSWNGFTFMSLGERKQGGGRRVWGPEDGDSHVTLE